MNKIKIQELVLKNGKPLALDKFLWDEKSRTFSCSVDRLTIVFYGMLDCTINAGDYCTINAGDYCTINAGPSCTIVRKGVFEFFSPPPGGDAA